MKASATALFKTVRGFASKKKCLCHFMGFLSIINHQQTPQSCQSQMELC